MKHLLPVEHSPFGGEEFECIFPTTAVQREILLGVWLGGQDANLAFNECTVLHLTGALARTAFEAAYGELVNVHDVLRMVFTADGEQGLVRRSVDAPWEFVDLSMLSQSSRDHALRALHEREVTRGFELPHGPLYRATLVRLDARHHQFLFSAHHVVCDWWTTGVLLRHLGLLYHGQRHAQSRAVTAAGYAAYALDQHRWEQGPEGKADLAYWRARLEGYVHDWELPSARARGSRRTYESRRVDVRWSAEETGALRQLARHHNTTLTVAFLSVLQLWLHLESGADDVVIGVPAAGQPLVEGGELAGHCVHLLPVRLQCASAMTIASVVSRCRATVLEAIEHRGVTYSTLLDQVTDRRSGHPPLVQLTANIDMGLPRLDFDDLCVEYATIPRRYDAFDLSINVVASSECFTVQCQFNTTHYDEHAVQRWVTDWSALARVAVEFPELELQRLAASG